MTQYKGYYIDGITFKTKKEIDEFIKKNNIELFKRYCKIFSNHPTIEASIVCAEQATKLHDNFNISHNEIEAIEIEAIK